jgi:hypothetical protein
MCTAKGKPCLSTRMLIFIPLTFWPIRILGAAGQFCWWI